MPELNFLPASWAHSSIGDLVHIDSGHLNTEHAVPDGRYPFFTCAPEPSRINNYEHDREAVLLGGNNANAIFPVFYYKGRFTARQRVYVMWSKDEVILDNRYFYYALKQAVTDFRDQALGTTTQFVTLKILAPYKIPLPPIGEQRAIARLLGALDDKLESNRRMNRTLESMAAALFKSWFVDFDPVVAKAAGRKPYGMDDATAALFPDGFADSELGPIPKSWRVSQIGKEVRVVGGSTPRTGIAEYWAGGQHCWITPRDLSRLRDPVVLDCERKITDRGLAQISSGLLPVGTVLLSSRAPIGYLAIAEVPVAVNQGFIAMVCNGSLPNQYVFHWTGESIDEVIGRAGGTTFAEISKQNFRPIPVLLPEQNVLTVFQQMAATWHAQIVANVKETKHLSELRDRLLPELLSGEIRLADAEKQVAKVL